MVKYVLRNRTGLPKCVQCLRTLFVGNARLTNEKIGKGTKENVSELLENAVNLEEEMPEPREEAWATSPYPKGTPSRNQSLLSMRPRVNPQETSIILFPGQGTQYVGMGKDLINIPVVKDMFKEANEILGYDLLKLCLNGPKEKLDKTEFAQPAILVTSLASLERLKDHRPSAIENCVATAGFSLGEISSLVLSGALSFSSAVALVKIRGELMQLASEMSQGAMATVLYGPDSQMGAACARAKEYAISKGVQDAYCGIANYLFPHGKIVAGSELAIQFLEQHKSDFKLRKIKRLPVSGAFHTPLMTPAIEPFKEALKKIRISDPMIAVHSNFDGKYYRNADHIRRQLPKQILAPVKWEQTLHILYERPKDMPYPRTFECGPGKSVSTILKMVNAKAWDSCMNVPA